MASLAQAIHTFHKGGLSPKEFFAQVDRVLATEQADSARLLDSLAQDDAQSLLPPDVYGELQRRIARMAAAKNRAGGDDTRMQTELAGQHVASRTSQATGFDAHPPAGLERMKGVGDTLNGRFVLEECIGFGGMGTVYKALDLRKLEASDRKPYIAIKVLNVQFRGHPKSLIALQREARKAQTLAHPNIVTVYDFDRDGSMVYLTMEYLSGKPLSQVLRAPGFAGMPYADALHIVTGIARALAYAHERGFVHCDLKPANVFLSDKNEVKVIDFGIARVFHKTEEDVEATVFDAGSLGGLTPAYASPEMIEHLEPDPRDDIYALACITYELLTGRHPFDRMSATQARNAGMRPHRPEHLGRRQWRTLKSALSFDRATRTPSVTDFLQEMRGERRQAVYVALVASGLTIVVLLAIGLSYYWASGIRQGGAPPVESAGSSAPVPAAPESPVAAAPAPTVPAQSTPEPSAPEPTLSLAAVTPVLAKIPCSALAATVRGATLQVQGYVPSQFGLPRLRQTLGTIPGVKALDLDVRQVGADNCSLISALGPYWVSNRQAGTAASIQTRAANGELVEGDPLIVDIKTPGYDSYVHVDYYILDGSVAHLVPNQRARAHQAPPNYAAAVGSLGNWVISKPFGSELIVLLVTPAPLFKDVRPEVEPQSDYLRQMEKQLKQMTGKYGPDRIAVDFVQITTHARKP